VRENELPFSFPLPRRTGAGILGLAVSSFFLLRLSLQRLDVKVFPPFLDRALPFFPGMSGRSFLDRQKCLFSSRARRADVAPMWTSFFHPFLDIGSQ